MLERALYEYMTNTSAPLTYNSVLLWAGTCAVGRYHGYKQHSQFSRDCQDWVIVMDFGDTARSQRYE